jgi:hypothetical protein
MLCESDRVRLRGRQSLTKRLKPCGRYSLDASSGARQVFCISWRRWTPVAVVFSERSLMPAATGPLLMVRAHGVTNLSRTTSHQAEASPL